MKDHDYDKEVITINLLFYIEAFETQPVEVSRVGRVRTFALIALLEFSSASVVLGLLDDFRHYEVSSYRRNVERNNICAKCNERSLVTKMSRAPNLRAGLSRMRSFSSASNMFNSASLPHQDLNKVEVPKTQAKPVNEQPKQAKKTMAQLDDELRAAMEGRAGDGGLAGSELEGGKQVGLKRGIKDNMFRYI